MPGAVMKSESSHRVYTLWIRLGFFAGFIAIGLRLGGEQTNNVIPKEWRFTTSAYDRAALRLLLDEVNKAARELQLPEKLPITPESLVEVHIQPPFWSERAGTFGSVSTSNYHYYASQGNKLSYIVRNLGASDERLPEYMASLNRRYAAPKNEINTNAAYVLATQWLAAASVDALRLERESKIRIRTWELGDKFVPVYSICWAQPHEAIQSTGISDDDGYEPVASIEFLEPERRLLQMHVSKASYIKRPSLVVPEREKLLQETDDPRMRQLWFTCEPYKEAALQVMLKEVNRVCWDLGLPVKLPIYASNLTRAVIETPYTADNLGRFATLYTDDYIYGANAGNKLSYINRSLRFRGEESKYLSMLKLRYAAPKSQINTNAAYVLATQWLAAAFVDVKALEQDCSVGIHPWTLEGGKFVPLYTLEWRKEERANGKQETVATVEVLEPERLLQKLWVQKPEYIKGDPLGVPNREKLLAQTNAPSGLSSPVKH